MITSGDWYALVSIIEHPSLEWYMKEYFAYYEFSFNFMVATAGTIPLLVIGAAVQVMGHGVAIGVLCLALLALLVFHEATAFWMLASRRFLRKIIIYSLLSESSQP